QGEPGDDQHRATPQRAEQRDEVRVQDVGLDREHGHRPQVRDDEHAERDPAWQRVQLELVVQDLDHDQRAGEAHAGREVEQSAVVGLVAHAEQEEEAEAEGDADRHLERAREQHGRAAGGHLAQVDLEPDHEQEQDQADLRHGLDALLVGDPPEADVRADDHAREEIGDDQRLLEAPRDGGDQRRGAGADADAREKAEVVGDDHRAAAVSTGSASTSSRGSWRATVSGSVGASPPALTALTMWPERLASMCGRTAATVRTGPSRFVSSIHRQSLLLSFSSLPWRRTPAMLTRTSTWPMALIASSIIEWTEESLRTSVVRARAASDVPRWRISSTVRSIR